MLLMFYEFNLFKYFKIDFYVLFNFFCNFKLNSFTWLFFKISKEIIVVFNKLKKKDLKVMFFKKLKKNYYNIFK